MEGARSFTWRRRRAAGATLLCAVATFGPSVAAVETGTTPPPERVTARGGLAWIFFSEDLNLVGDLGVDLPFFAARGDDLLLYLSLDTRTAIRRAISGFTFDVRDLGYVLEIGGRRSLGGGSLISGFAGQWGKEKADAPGEPFVRYVGIGIESQGYRRQQVGRALEWWANVGAVVEDRETEADLAFRGEVRWLDRPRDRVSMGADLRVDVLAKASASSADVATGPRLVLVLSGDRRASFFLHYLRGRNPLGLETSGLALGFEYAEGPSPVGRASPPDIRGSLGFGAGDTRLAGRLDLQFLSPAFWGDRRVAVEVEANVLTAEDTGELYYLYDVGLERDSPGRIEGVYFHHRSNHRLAEPGDRITSIDVIEAGVETPGWARVGVPPRSRWGSVDVRARLGWLLDSSFGEDRRWHARAGVRLSPPRALGRVLPYVAGEAEGGDVERHAYAIGIAAPGDLDFRLEYRSDAQFFGRDRTALLFLATAGF